jgi:hypothetical protein
MLWTYPSKAEKREKKGRSWNGWYNAQYVEAHRLQQE